MKILSKKEKLKKILKVVKNLEKFILKIEENQNYKRNIVFFKKIQDKFLKIKKYIHNINKQKNIIYHEISESQYEPTDRELWEKSKNLAKKTFKVYPSAYANAWAAKKYKEMGGKWRRKKKK